MVLKQVCCWCLVLLLVGGVGAVQGQDHDLAAVDADLESLVEQSRVARVGAILRGDSSQPDPEINRILERVTATLERLVAEDPGSFELHMRLGRLYGLDLPTGSDSRHETAIRHYRTAIRLRPGDPEPRLKLAIQLYKNGSLKEARSECLGYLAAGGEEPEAYRYLACINLELGELNQALQHARHYAQEEPGRLAEHLMSLVLAQTEAAGVEPVPGSGPEVKQLPSAPSASAFLAEVRAAEYDELSPPAEAVQCRWDLSAGRVYEYSYQQTVMAAFHGDRKSSLKAKADLSVKAQPDGTAKLVLANTEVETDLGGHKRETKGMSTMVITGMLPDGSIPEGRTDVETLLRLLLPLPRAPLLVGETEIQPIRFPFNAAGSPLFAEGSLELRFSRVVYVRGCDCVQLDYRVTVDRLDVPEEVPGSFNLFLSGEGRHIFDARDGKTKEATLALLMVIDADMPRPRTRPSEDGGLEVEDTKQETPSYEMRMVSDNLVTITME